MMADAETGQSAPMMKVLLQKLWCLVNTFILKWRKTERFSYNFISHHKHEVADLIYNNRWFISACRDIRDPRRSFPIFKCFTPLNLLNFLGSGQFFIFHNPMFTASYERHSLAEVLILFTAAWAGVTMPALSGFFMLQYIYPLTLYHFKSLKGLNMPLRRDQLRTFRILTQFDFLIDFL